MFPIHGEARIYYPATIAAAGIEAHKFGVKSGGFCEVLGFEPNKGYAQYLGPWGLTWICQQQRTENDS